MRYICHPFVIIFVVILNGCEIITTQHFFEMFDLFLFSRKMEKAKRFFFENLPKIQRVFSTRSSFIKLVIAMLQSQLFFSMQIIICIRAPKNLLNLSIHFSRVQLSTSLLKYYYALTIFFP